MRVLVLAVLAWGALAASAAAQATAGFKDWWTACDEQRTCWAFGFAPEDTADGWVRVARGGENGALPEVLLAAANFEGAEQALSVQMRVVVDGAPELVLPPFTAQADENSGPFYVARVREPTLARALIRAMRKGSKVRLRLRGFPEVAVSLDGASAALLWLDDQQKRVGTTTALVKTGDKPAAAVPPIPAGRSVKAVRPVAQGKLPTRFPPAMNANAALKVCREEQRETNRPPDLLAARLGGGKMLWGVGCGHGAYNMNYDLFIGDEQGRGLKPVRLRAAGTEGDGPDNSIVNPGFDAKSMTLSGFFKGRGIGDCGAEERWTWDGQRFVPSWEAVMGDCRGVPLHYWPVTRRATIVR